MDWDEARLLPSALSLGVGGIAALMLFLGAALEGNPLAPLVLVAALVLLVASRAVEPGRRWSLLLGSWAAGLGVAVWLAVAAVTHDAQRPVQSVFSIGFAAASLWVGRFLAAETRPPPWASWSWDEPVTPPDGHPEDSGWIEEVSPSSRYPGSISTGRAGAEPFARAGG